MNYNFGSGRNPGTGREGQNPYYYDGNILETAGKKKKSVLFVSQLSIMNVLSAKG